MSSSSDESIGKSSGSWTVTDFGQITSASYNALPKLAHHLRLGDLLSLSGVVEHEVIRDALSKFEDQGLPLGKILVNSGYIPEALLKAALDLQNLVNNRQLPLRVAVRVLTQCHKEGMNLGQAFEKTSLVKPEDHQSNKLGQLLADAGVVPPELIDSFLQSSSNTGLPLGHVLCFSGTISGSLLETALLGQQLVRRSSISRDHCLNAIAMAYARESELMKLAPNTTFERTLIKHTPRLGEMLFEAELISDNLLFEALRQSFILAIPCGQVMIDGSQGFPVGSEFLYGACRMQEIIDGELLTASQAQECLKLMKVFELPYERALAIASCRSTVENPSTLMLELLIEAGYPIYARLDNASEELLSRVKVNYNQGADVCRLMEKELKTPGPVLSRALRAAGLLRLEKLTREMVVLALDMALREAVEFDEALVMCGVRPRSRLAWPANFI
jgi:hypothetical protein